MWFLSCIVCVSLGSGLSVFVVSGVHTFFLAEITSSLSVPFGIVKRHSISFGFLVDTTFFCSCILCFCLLFPMWMVWIASLDTWDVGPPQGIALFCAKRISKIFGKAKQRCNIPNIDVIYYSCEMMVLPAFWMYLPRMLNYSLVSCLFHSFLTSANMSTHQRAALVSAGGCDDSILRRLFVIYVVIFFWVVMAQFILWKQKPMAMHQSNGGKPSGAGYGGQGFVIQSIDASVFFLVCLLVIDFRCRPSRLCWRDHSKLSGQREDISKWRNSTTQWHRETAFIVIYKS